MRVLVWVHKESCEALAATLQALLAADLPYNTTRMVYVCDDSCDPEKEYVCGSLGPEVTYVSGRKKMKGGQGRRAQCCAATAAGAPADPAPASVRGDTNTRRSNRPCPTSPPAQAR